MIPPASAIVEFIHAVTDTPWPSAEDQFHGYFQRLGCELIAGDHDSGHLPGLTGGAFVTHRLATQHPSWTALNGSLFSLNFFAHEGDPDAVNAGYDGVRAGLISLFGPPFDEPPAHRGNRAAAWLAGDTEIELYAHVSLAPVLQIGLGHKERNAAYEQRLPPDAGGPRA